MGPLAGQGCERIVSAVAGRLVDQHHSLPIHVPLTLIVEVAMHDGTENDNHSVSMEVLWKNRAVHAYL